VHLQHLQDQGNERLNTATGVIAAVFVIAGLLPQYYEVFKFKAGACTFLPLLLEPSPVLELHVHG